MKGILISVLLSLAVCQISSQRPGGPGGFGPPGGPGGFGPPGGPGGFGPPGGPGGFGPPGGPGGFGPPGGPGGFGPPGGPGGFGPPGGPGGFGPPGGPGGPGGFGPPGGPPPFGRPPPPPGPPPSGPRPGGPPPSGPPPVAPLPALDKGGCVPNPAANEALLRRLYDEVFSQKNVTNIADFYAVNHIEHNPFDHDGRDAVVELMTTGTLGGPPVQIEIQRMISGADFVWVHSKFPIVKLNSTFAIVDIFRFECGIIHEHWDVLQDTQNLPGPVVSTHPFF